MTITHSAVVDDPRGVDVLTADGAIATVRPVRADDRAALTRLCHEASDLTTSRFCSLAGEATGSTAADRSCLSDASGHLAVVAVSGARIAGMACLGFDRGSRTGEVSVVIAGPQRGRGIGALLVDDLSARARRAGMTRLVGDAMTGRLWIAGRSPENDETETLLRAVDARDRPAVPTLPRVLLEPRTIAVTGAMKRRGSIGFEMVRAIRDYGFTGRLCPVNTSGRPVCGTPAYRTVTDLPDQVDLLIVAEAGVLVPQVLSEAGKHGVRSVVLACGAPADGPGVRRIAHENGMGLLGPGSLGTMNTDPRVRLNATISPARPPAGKLAMAAHSSAVGIAMLEHATRSGCGLSGFVSLGDTADLTFDDLMQYWYADPGTTVVALHLNGLGAGGRFGRHARALARRKPVLAIRSGRATADDLYAQAGILRMTDLDELTDTARLLADQPLPTGARLGLVGNAGGLGQLTAEIAEHLGFTVPGLSPSLREHLPSGADNPVDLGSGATPEQIAAAADAMAASGEIDILLLPIVGTRANVPAAILNRVATALERHTRLTTAVVLTGTPDDIHRIGLRNIPIYRQPGRAMQALAHAYRYTRWQSGPLGHGVTPGGMDRGRVRTLITHAATDRRGWTPRSVAVDVLDAYGITVLPGCHARTGIDAVAAADRLGYPVMIRPAAGSPAPTRRGTGWRGLTTAAAVRETFDAVVRSCGSGTGVLVQPQFNAVMELTTRIRRVPGFGPVVEARPNGRPGDLVRRIVPLTDVDAARMRNALAPVWPRAGRRPPTDAIAVEDLILRLSALADDHAEIAELDLGPVLVGPHGVVAADVRLRLTTRSPAAGGDAAWQGSSRS
jgi:acyl-CoA synthetase (NDP forming)